MGNINLRNLGKVLLVEADSSKAQRRAEDLTGEGALVEVVEYEFQVLTRLAHPNHGYSFVILDAMAMYPDAAKQKLLANWDIFEQAN